MLTVQSQGTEFLLVAVQPLTELGAAADPTGFTVEMTFSATRQLGVSPVWHAATWQSNYGAIPARFYARCKIGAGTSVGALTTGVWYPFVRITATAETPVVEGDPFRVS